MDTNSEEDISDLCSIFVFFRTRSICHCLPAASSRAWSLQYFCQAVSVCCLPAVFNSLSFTTRRFDHGCGIKS